MSRTRSGISGSTRSRRPARCCCSTPACGFRKPDDPEGEQGAARGVSWPRPRTAPVGRRAARSSGRARPQQRHRGCEMNDIDKQTVVGVLNRLLEAELAGVVRYTHYSFLVFGFGRIPIVSWLRTQADESLLHAQQVGDWITALGAYPSLAIGPLLDSHKTDIGAMLRESLETEAQALRLYRELLAQVEGQSVALEEFARQMILAEEMHAAEVDKMLRKPG